MIKFIVGKADLNISAAVRDELISLLENNTDDQNIIYIVPDQFEYETEKSIYRILDEKDLLHRFYEIRITTFDRLCREILEACGEHRPFADDIVKNIIMHKTVSENKTALSALNKIAARTGFCDRMVKTVSTLKTSGISARDLEFSINTLTKTDKNFSADRPIMKKLTEINMLYTNYEALLSGYVDKLDTTAMAADNIAKQKCDVFSGASVFVDCFNDFTQSQLHFLRRVIEHSDNATFGFTSLLNSDRDVFRTANSHIERLKQFALDEGLNVEFVTEGIESRFSDNSPLCGLSKYLFQNVLNRDTLGDSCELVTARSVYEELDYAAAKIKELTIDKGMRYNEIAVLCTDVAAYGKYVESVFKKYDIPLFLDTPEPILYQPLINLVFSILNALDNFSPDTVLSCVKTNFFAKPKKDEDIDEPANLNKENGKKGKTKYIKLSDKDIDEFEKYIFEWDLKTSHLKKTFSFMRNNAGHNYTQQTAEQVRLAVAVPLLELQKRLHKQGKSINGAYITEQLYEFLINEVGMERVLFSRCKKEQTDLTEKNEDEEILDSEKVALYQRLWNYLIDIFNKLHTELSGTNLTIGEYREIFREICAATKLADPPQLIDCVLVGDIDRTRADNIKAAFIVGASYDAFPTPASEAGIFSQYEIELICDKIMHIDADLTDGDVSSAIDMISHIGDNVRREYCLKSIKEQYFLSLYRAYRAVSLPTEYLCISCPAIDDSGEALVVSDVFGEIAATFKDTHTLNADSKDNKFYCRTLKAAKMRYAMELERGSRENEVLRKVLENEDAEFVKTLDEIKESRRDAVYDGSNGGHFSGKHSIEPKTARLLFPNSIGTTAIEKLNICKFKYFCEFGLKIDERSQRSFTNSKRGESIHFIFQKVLEEYSGDMNAFFALKRSELLSLSKKYLAEYRENETNNDGAEDRRTEYLFNNIANSATDVLITMQTELFARRYRPKFFELDIRNDQSSHTIINNETAVTAQLNDAELFSETATNLTAPNTLQITGSEPCLITAPLELTLDDGSAFKVYGVIDRIDMFRDGVSDSGKPIAYIRVIDYKSSVHSFDLNNAQNGVNIQMLLYLFALQSSNENNPDIELRPGGVSYIPSNNEGALDEEADPYRLLAMNYHESGLFIKDKTTENDLKKYTDFIYKKFDSDKTIAPRDLANIKSSFEPKQLNVADADLFNVLRNDIINKVKENLDAIFSGTIDALPTLYYETYTKPDGKSGSKLKNACEYCRFKEICQNAGKNVNKIEKAALKPKTVKKDDERTFWENKYIKEDK